MNDRPREDASRATLLDRVFGHGEAPAWWGVPVASIAGCEVRLHLVTPVFIAAALLYAFWNGPGPVFVGAGLVALALVVVSREAVRGHVLVRWAGRRPESVTLWPLGAVWSFADDRDAEGEATGAVLACCATFAAAMAGALLVGLVVGDWTALRFDPRTPASVLASPAFTSQSTPATLLGLFCWQLYAMSVYCLAASLVPMLPLDAGVLLRARAADPATGPRVGLVASVILVAGGLVAYLPIVAAVGFCGGVVCWHAWQAQRFAIDPAGVDRWREVLAADETEAGDPPIHPEQRERIEQILAKISATGMDSLTRAERRELARATDDLRRS